MFLLNDSVFSLCNILPSTVFNSHSYYSFIPHTTQLQPFQYRVYVQLFLLLQIICVLQTPCYLFLDQIRRVILLTNFPFTPILLNHGIKYTIYSLFWKLLFISPLHMPSQNYHCSIPPAYSLSLIHI